FQITRLRMGSPLGALDCKASATPGASLDGESPERTVFKSRDLRRGAMAQGQRRATVLDTGLAVPAQWGAARTGRDLTPASRPLRLPAAHRRSTSKATEDSR